MEMAIAALKPFSGRPQATVLGRAERFDILQAALLNGISSHIFDFDDTHLKTVIHPAGPVASAILALAEYRQTSGTDFLNALLLGVETECQIGKAVYPTHYDVGWDITGTTGVFGAAAAAGKLLGLDTKRMAWALGLAATQPVGLRNVRNDDEELPPRAGGAERTYCSIARGARLYHFRGGNRGRAGLGQRG